MKPQSTRTDAGRRRNDPEGVRARILDHAAKLFQQQGYHATSMHDLLKATNISAGALHHHFPTKKAVALGALAERVRPAVQKAWITPIHEAATPEVGIADVFSEIIAGIRRRGSVLGCPLNNLALELSLADREFRDAIQGIFSEWQTALSERLASTRAGSRLDDENRSAAANFIISVYSGAMNMAKASQSPSPLVDAARFLAQWLREQRLAD